MKATRASAPGKVVLCGEYAVLYGYPAVAAAVDRRACVRLEPLAGDDLELETRGYLDGRRRLHPRADGGFDYPEGAPDERAFELFELAWKAFCRGRPGGWSVTLDTAAFMHPDGRKLGIGSSAALAVSLTAALAATGSADAVLPLALDLHRGFQGGGSGVDVACAVHGGVIAYRMGEASPAALSLPPSLHCAILWSGRPAATGARIASLADGLKRRAGRASLYALGRSAAAVAERWRDGDAAALLDALSAFAGRLAGFDADFGLGIFDAGHRALFDVAAAGGVVYKPCGAGGGDVGAAFAADAEHLERFVALAEGRGFAVLDVALGAEGLQLAPVSAGKLTDKRLG